MAPLLDRWPVMPTRSESCRIAVVALVVLAAVILASIAFDWTLAPGPSFELTTNPGADLPF